MRPISCGTTEGVGVTYLCGKARRRRATGRLGRAIGTRLAARLRGRRLVRLRGKSGSSGSLDIISCLAETCGRSSEGRQLRGKGARRRGL